MQTTRIMKSRIARIITGGVVGAGLVAAAAMPSAAAGPSLSIDPVEGPPGTSVFVKSNEGCKPPEGSTDWQATVWLDSAGRLLNVTHVRPDSAGHWTANLTVPADTPPGVIYVMANCFDQGSGVDRSRDVTYDPAPFKVVPKPTAPAPTNPPSPKPEPTKQPPAPKKPGAPRYTG